MIARSQEEILHVLSICEVCEQYRGQQKNAVGRTEVNCAACKTCGRKVISVEIQACPVGKFAAARMGAERKGEDMVVEDMYAQKRWEFLEKRNAQLAALKLGPVNEETLDCPGGEHFWPPGHRIGSFKNRRLGTGPDNRGRPVGAHVQPQPKRPDWGEPQLCRAVPEDMSGIFDRVVMISVEGRADRREKALPRMREQGWPFREPELKLVTHGDHIGVPKGWSHGGGAWGCMLSHREVLWQAIQDKVHTLLVMEDDAWVCDDFAAKVRQFLAHVPDDWGQIMFGGQLMGDGRQKRVNEHARRVSQCERTHCYALRGEAIRSLWLWWNQVGANAHCDWMMGDWQDHSHWPCYIPNQFLVAQMESRSDLTGRVEPLRTWSTDGAARPVAPTSKYAMPAKEELDREYGAETRHFVHSGKIGDLIYALPAVKALGGGVIWMDDWEGETKMRVTPELVEQQIRPLILAGAGEYVKDVRFCDSRPKTFETDLNRWRGQGTGNIAYDHFKLLGLDYDLADEPWMKFEAEPVAEVVFWRTPRYQNHMFPWKKVYEEHKDRAVFLGLPEEHAAFEREIGPIKYHPKATLLDAAKVIAGAKLGLGNKSSLAATAIACGTKVIIEDGGNLGDVTLGVTRIRTAQGGEIADEQEFRETDITAVVLCKGRLRQLKACVAAARRCGLRVIVVDADCPDKCGDWVRSLNDPRVSVVEYAGEFSIASAKNAGLREVETGYTMILDADVVLWPNEFLGLVDHKGIDGQHFWCVGPLTGMWGWCVFPTGLALLDDQFIGYGREDCDLFFTLEGRGCHGVKLAKRFFSHINHSDDDRSRFLGRHKDLCIEENDQIMLKKWGVKSWR